MKPIKNQKKAPKKTFILRGPLFYIFLFFFTSSHAQTTFYVAKTGSDGNAGTAALPWLTIQHACNSATAGSTVYIKTGTYTESIWMNVSGTSGNPITFSNFGSDVVTIDGGSTNTQTELLNISGQNFIRIIGLRFTNAMGNFSKGIVVRNGAHDIDILNNKVSNIHFSTNPSAAVGSGVNVNPMLVYGENAAISCSNINISGNEIFNCRTGYSEAMTLNGNVDGFTITDNLVHDITNIGMDMAGGYGVCSDVAKDFARNGTVVGNTVFNCISAAAVAAGIYVDGGQNIVIARNTAHDCGRGYEIGCENQGKIATNITLRDNIAYHNREAGVGIGGYNYPTTGKVTNSKILNNTFYDDATLNTGDGELLVEYTEGCSIQNNIFYATNAARKFLVTRLSSTGLTLDYNIYYHANGAATAVSDFNGTVYSSFATYKTGTGKDAHSTFINPQFMSLATSNLHIVANSPAQNGGNPTFVAAVGETDFDGEPRVYDTKVDIGADEIQTPLPLELLAFSGVNSSLGNALKWQTAGEINVAHFILERYTEGSLLWEFMGEVKAMNQPKSINNYAFMDELPVEKAYYRLKIVDFNGAFYFSKILFLEKESDKTTIKIYPNPTVDGVFFDANEQPFKVTIRDVLGQVKAVLQSPKMVNLSDYTEGSYFFEIESKGHFTVHKIIKK
jgi:Secretion system C-terminal sorting domain/Right handed beta helix region